MLEKLLITGAAGGVAQLILPHIGHLAKTMRLSDLIEPEEIPEGAEFVTCDLGSEDDVNDLVAGCDGIINLGGRSTEDSFANLLTPNIVGIHNLYEAARLNGMPRIVQASSNHAIGFYRQGERINAKALTRPDSWYGVTKVYGEAVASMYFEKFGQETAIIRIGSCFEKPLDYRMFATWLAPQDFASMLTRIFEVPRLGCPIIYGVSNNKVCWWDNSQVQYLGWAPAESSDQFSSDLNYPRPSADDPAAIYHGGKFINFPIMKTTTER
ncbi:MAG: NAD(P)-dependent oxidoreductase [Pseudomonadota bacterium]